MKKLIAILILLIPFIGHGQESINEQSRFSVGVNFSPNFSYRTLSYPERLEPLVEAREKYEHPSLGFNTGIAARYLIIPNLEVELGLQFSSQTNMFKNDPLSDPTGEGSPGVANYQLRFHYLEIPLRLNYRVIDKKFFGYITAGATLNQFLYDKSITRITYSNGDKVAIASGITDFNKKTIGLIGGVGVGYHINPRFNIRVEPLFRYSLTALAETPIDQNIYSIGCQMGLIMRF
ncbi:PorT family protein [Cryomorpha ignava]|uniref:PorT family protein n=1 Tax=Cryomorpha ignava TaxID=101383 RepID=A0A7K3WV38_9FLAO|nr:outer membrane beta-barrel protein [Cryomorpha ignava]NEN25549.1 PorT family protein [Cryomorpha ignava]